MNIINELEYIIQDKMKAIKDLREMLKDGIKIVNPDIDGIEMAYKDIQNIIQELKEKYK